MRRRDDSIQEAAELQGQRLKKEDKAGKSNDSCLREFRKKKKRKSKAAINWRQTNCTSKYPECQRVTFPSSQLKSDTKIRLNYTCWERSGTSHRRSHKLLPPAGVSFVLFFLIRHLLKLLPDQANISERLSKLWSCQKWSSLYSVSNMHFY